MNRHSLDLLSSIALFLRSFGDVGKLIGKQGRIARSIHTILGAASMKVEHSYALDIIQGQDDSAKSSRRGGLVPLNTPNWQLSELTS